MKTYSITSNLQAFAPVSVSARTEAALTPASFAPTLPGKFVLKLLSPAFGIICLAVAPQWMTARDAGWRTTLLLAAGYIAWTYLEYLWHRFILHQPTSHHHSHAHLASTSHPVPCGTRRALVALLLGFTILASIFLAGYFFLAAGFCLGWLTCCYMRVFMQWKGMSRFLPRLYRQYLYHQAGGNDRGFGWTTVIWDHYFGTHVPLGYVYNEKKAA